MTNFQVGQPVPKSEKLRILNIADTGSCTFVVERGDFKY